VTDSSPAPRGGSNGDGRALGRRARRRLAFHTPPPPKNPRLLKLEQERAREAQNRLADWITGFAGSMTFVYIHLVWFACWIGFGVEDYPFGLLTMIVSLEAIFLSTFVLISQNRADARRQVIADQEWETIQREDRQNQELIDLSTRILRLTQETRGSARMMEEGRDQNRELLELSRQTLALTRELSPPLQSG
jgi:uncharacterized membrane protein